MLLPRPHTIPPCGEVHPEFSHSGGVFSVSGQQTGSDAPWIWQSPSQGPPSLPGRHLLLRLRPSCAAGGARMGGVKGCGSSHRQQEMAGRRLALAPLAGPVLRHILRWPEAPAGWSPVPSRHGHPCSQPPPQVSLRAHHQCRLGSLQK